MQVVPVTSLLLFSPEQLRVEAGDQLKEHRQRYDQFGSEAAPQTWRLAEVTQEQHCEETVQREPDQPEQQPLAQAAHYVARAHRPWRLHPGLAFGCLPPRNAKEEDVDGEQFDERKPDGEFGRAGQNEHRLHEYSHGLIDEDEWRHIVQEHGHFALRT